MKKTILMLALGAALFNTVGAQPDAGLTTEFDKVLKEEFPLNGSGATVLVSSRGKIIYQKAVGMANAELGAPMQADHVFRIASLTKQFTAIAILQLMEAGALDLQDEITRFIPGYPTQGARITIEHLLTHTSGIRDYASIKDTVQRGKTDLSPKEMIEFFKNQPMRFAPGTRHEYSNSNYFLLGYIIEKLTGKTYGQYLEEAIFRPLGMSHSLLASEGRIVNNRASGYTRNKSGLANAPYLSMTHPYAAGAILSTVEDLFTWQQAVQSFKLVKKETLQKAWAPYKLADGKESAYGYGWRMGFIQESPSLWHGGLINGFATMALYLPKEDVYVAVLTNCDCTSPEYLVARLAAVAIRKPYAYKEVTLPDSVLQTYAGVYENAEGDQQVISVANGKLYAQRGRAPRVAVKAFAQGKFFFDDPTITMEFAVARNGKAGKLTIKSRRAMEVWNRTDKPQLSTEGLKLEEKILESYTGQYEVNAQFSFTVSREGDRLFLQATGQEKLEMFAEAPNKFFLKVNDAQLQFVGEGGKITKVVLKQGGRSTEAMKIK